MRTRTNQPSFPVFGAFVALTVVAIVTYVILWAIVNSAGHSTVFTDQWLMIAGLTGWLSSVFALLPVVPVADRGLMPCVVGYFMGGGLRVIICIAATVAAITQFDAPQLPWAVMMLGMYFILLLVEVGLVARHVWNMSAEPDENGSWTDANQAETAT